MMTESKSSKEIGFKSIKLLKEESLGAGSYGTVCKAMCNDLLCAAKLMNYMFLDKKADLMASFKNECEVLSSLHHPNIIQYLGTYQDPSTSLPVLLMELMDQSLTDFLDNYETIPLHKQVNICHDIALALSFLHSNGIIHRDLSSNNVLMIGNIRAKVTDFGMAKIWDRNVQASERSLTKHPGCDVYMPPEAMFEGSQYSEKLDTFSFGVIIIQILTQQYPQPGKQFKTVYVSDPCFPNGIETRATEVERRKDHIDLIEPDHLLLPMALDCLRDKDTDRPSSKDLCHSVTTLKEASQYIDSKVSANTDKLMEDIEKQVREMQSMSFFPDEENQLLTEVPTQSSVEKPIQSVHFEQESKRRSNSPIVVKPTQSVDSKQDGERCECEMSQNESFIEDQAKNEEIEQLKGQLASALELVEDKEMKLQSYEKEVTSLKEKIKVLVRKMESRRQSLLIASPVELKKVTLTWKKGVKAPKPLSRTTEAIVIAGNVVYFRPGSTREIHGYNIVMKCWSQFPDTKIGDCSLAIIKRKLTTIGGKDNSEYSDKLLSLVESDGKKQWIKIFPSMSIKRSNAITVPCGSYLIIAGGEGEAGYLKDVEVLNMNTDTLSWSKVASLPEPLVFSSATFNGTHLFIMGGWVEKMTPSYSVLSCSLETLIQSSETSDEVASRSSDSPWQQITSLPIKGSTCVTVKGRLLSIGGRDVHRPTTAVHIYNPLSKTWEILGHMTHPRHQSYVAVLHKKLLVFGGWILSKKQVLCETDIVEVAAIV